MRRRTLIRSLGVLSGAAVTAAGQQAPGPTKDQTKDRESWNGVYSSTPDLVTGYPNRFLAEVAQARKPGKALDIGMGQGRNSLHLARLGWDVTGVDISDAGIEIARKQAAKEGLKLNYVVGDFFQFDLGKEHWDLIAGVYMGGLVTRQAARIAAGLRNGGVLVVENFHIDINRRGIGGDPLGYRVNALLDAFAPVLRIVRYEEVQDFPDWSNRGEKVPLVRMVARKG